MEPDLPKSLETAAEAAYRIVEQYTLTNRVFCSSDYETVVGDLARRLDARVHAYSSHQERNGWEIHPRWDPVRATISRNGETIYDGLRHPLALIALSSPFRGTVPLETLKEHLHFDRRHPEALPYHFRQMYRPWDRDWGFCVPATFFDRLEPGDYEVDIRIAEAPGELRILDAAVPGRRPETVLLAAHLDHPGMANDDLAGCAVGVAFIEWLRDKDPKFTYRLILHQEVIGAEYYLSSLTDPQRALLVDGVFLEMLGSESQLGFQHSLRGEDLLLRRMMDYCRTEGIDHRTGGYGDIVVNGEYVWDSHGVSLASFSRFPYPEYHSSRDDLSIITKRALGESLQVLVGGVEALENDPFLFKNFSGTVATAHPDFGLYVDPGQAGLGNGPEPDGDGLRNAMERIPTLRTPMAVAELARSCGVSEDVLRSYLSRWEEKGLLDIL